VPFKSARATHPSGPTGLADGLELESTPTRDGESAPRHLRLAMPRQMRWFPRFRTTGAELGYTPITIKWWKFRVQGQRRKPLQVTAAAWTYDDGPGIFPPLVIWAIVRNNGGTREGCRS